MGPKNNFWLFSSVIIFTTVLLVESSPFPHRSSTDLQDLKDGNDKNADIYRLPNDVIPVSYELKMAPDLEKLTFTGQVEIIVHVHFTTDRIILHSKNLQIQNVMVTGAEGSVKNATVPIPTSHTLDEKNEIIIIKTEGKFNYNQNYKISITFQGKFESGYTGFYRASYKSEDNQTHWFVATQFEQTYARRAFPCFDEPRFRTPFTIYLAHSKKHVAISNMPSETTELLPADSMSNGLGYEKFQPTPPMPTYIVAFMVSDFKQFTDQNLDQRIRVNARPDLIQKAQYTLQQASKLLAFFEGYFGIPYPLPKLDIVAIPSFRGGMENWGMIVFDENMVILKNDYKIFEAAVTTIISHEFAHLWFGDLVSPSWYDYLWLKDGFATYFQFFASAAIEPTWKQEEIFVGIVTQNTLIEDISFERAITWPNRKIKDIERSYNEAMSYNKGAILIRMFELMFSAKTFQSALRRYLIDGQQNQHGLAVEKNLFDAFDKQVDFDSVSHIPPHVHASDIMKTWTENIGYPLITVTRSYEEGEVKITQTPYPRRIEASDARYQDQKWIVPLTYTTKSQQQFSNLQPVDWSFADKSTKLTGFNKLDWILFNLKRTGYYRVNYDPENWKLLIDQLMEDHTKIHVLNRAQLIDDALTLAEDQLINCTIASRLIKYLNNETSIIPWYPVSLWFQKFINEQSNSAPLKNQLKAILEKPLKKFGCISESDDEITILVKIQFLSLSKDLGINYCTEQLLQMYEKNHDNFNKIPQNLRPAVFCNALQHSDNPKTTFDHLWRNYRRSNEPYEKKQILESIFCCVQYLPDWVVTMYNDCLKNGCSILKMDHPERAFSMRKNLRNYQRSNEPDERKRISEFILLSSWWKDGVKVLDGLLDQDHVESASPAKTTLIKSFFNTLVTTEIIKPSQESINNFSILDEYGIEFWESLLNSIDSKIQTEEQLELVKEMEIEFESLDRNKYSKYIQMLRNLRINAEKKIAYRRSTKFMERFPGECLLSS
ncbi:aminopeptidase N-like [Planococcus citri]|uniref:aminopeptidase N-like n=1 Tax=Planococcus citri TaxID=170843 RepID=UPI0031F8CD4A